MLVSILIPAYNAERWIAETVASALAQTWPTTEVIIVDDGSSDATLAIARGFESPRVRVVAAEHRGASATRNRALAEAQGDYIQWLDADDLLAPDKIAVQLNRARGTSSRTLLSSAFGIFYWRPSKARFTPSAIWRDLDPLAFLRASFSENLWMSPAAWLVTRELTEAAGPWDERLTLNDDGEYFCRVVAASEAIRFAPNARCYYRQSGPGQLSRSSSRDALESFALSVSLCIDRALAMEDSDRTRYAAWRFVEHCSRSFVPDNRDLIDAVARRLGRELAIAPPNTKGRVAQAILGEDWGRRVLASGRQARLAAAVTWDRLCYRMHPPPLR